MASFPGKSTMGAIILKRDILKKNVCEKQKLILTVSVTWLMFFKVGVLVISLCVRERLVVKRMHIGIIDGG